MADIVHLFGDPTAIEGVPEAGDRNYTCYPHAPLIDRTSRTLTCKRCKQSLDPIDVLLQVSHRYDEWVRLLEETKALRKEVKSLKDEEKRVKQRTKSHSRKDAAEAVAAERKQHQQQLREVLTRTSEITRAARRIDQLVKERIANHGQQ